MADNPKKRYQVSFAKHGESPKALKWTGYRSAALHYRALVRGLRLNGKYILDAGCGMGDLLPFIYAKTDNFRYLGVDITPAFVEIARKRFAGHEFTTGDIFDGSLPSGSFDVVLSSGTMNHNDPGWLVKRKQMIKTLYGLAREVLAFNMAGSRQPPAAMADSRVAYAHIGEIERFCRTLSPNVIVRTGYHPRDFTVVIYRV